MTPEELKQIEEIVKKHARQTYDSGWLGITGILILIMFIGGCFKGCGY